MLPPVAADGYRLVRSRRRAAGLVHRREMCRGRFPVGALRCICIGKNSGKDRMITNVHFDVMSWLSVVIF